MARIRTVKPEFWTSPDVARLSRDARLLFIGTWTHADDHGYLTDDPERLLLQLYPGDREVQTEDVSSWLAELVRGGLLERLNDEDGRPLLRVANFRRHQRIDRPSRSRFAVPEAGAQRQLAPEPEAKPEDGDIPWEAKPTPKPKRRKVDPDALPAGFPDRLVPFVEPVQAILREISEGNGARGAVDPSRRAVAMALADFPRKDFLPAARSYRAWQLGPSCKRPAKDPVKGFRNQLGSDHCPDVLRPEPPGSTGDAAADSARERTERALRELEA